MPPNMITAALEMTSPVLSPVAPPSALVRAAAARSEAEPSAEPITAESRALSDPKAPAPALTT